MRTAADRAFSRDDFDIDDLGAGVVFEAMKVHPQIWLSGLVLENPFYNPDD